MFSRTLTHRLELICTSCNLSTQFDMKRLLHISTVICAKTNPFSTCPVRMFLAPRHGHRWHSNEHYCSSLSMPVDEDCSCASGGQRISLCCDNGREVSIPIMWLRDHCRCVDCFNSATSQRSVRAYNLDHLRIQEFSEKGELLCVRCKFDKLSILYSCWLQGVFS